MSLPNRGRSASHGNSGLSAGNPHLIFMADKNMVVIGDMGGTNGFEGDSEIFFKLD